MQQSDQARDACIRKGVVNALRVAPRGHKLSLTQLGEVLRERRLAQRDYGLQLGYRAFPVRQLAQDQQTMRIGKRAQKLGGVVAVCFQLLNIHRT